MESSSFPNEDPVKFWKDQYEISRVIVNLTERLLENAEARANQVTYEAQQFELNIQHRMTEYLGQAAIVERQRNEAVARIRIVENERNEAITQRDTARNERDAAITEVTEVTQNLEHVEEDLHQQIDDAQETIVALQHQIEVLQLMIPQEQDNDAENLDEPEDEDLEEPEVDDQEELELSDNEEFAESEGEN